jgi:hypothetical protein
MAYVYSLNVAADFADSVGQDGGAWRWRPFPLYVSFYDPLYLIPYYSPTFRSLASEIAGQTEHHFNGDYIYEAQVHFPLLSKQLLTAAL